MLAARFRLSVCLSLLVKVNLKAALLYFSAAVFETKSFISKRRTRNDTRACTSHKKERQRYVLGNKRSTSWSPETKSQFENSARENGVNVSGSITMK